MKSHVALLAASLIASFSAAFVAMPALADDIDFSQISCNDFLSDSKDDAVLLLIWIEGYFTKKSDPPIMYGAKAKTHAEAIRDYCAGQPNVSLIDAAKAVIK